MHLLILGLTLQKNNRTRTKGFTLLELLIAISIFAMLSLAAYQILQGVLRSSEISKRHSDSLARLQRAMLIIEQDFTQIAARRSRSEDQDTDDDSVINAGDLLFGSEDQGIEFTRIGWTNPLNLLPRSELLRVRYRLMDGQLQRLYFIYPDLPSGQIPQVQVLLDNIETLDFYFWNGGWQESWSKKKSLPAGVKIEFTSKQYGEIHREFLLAEGEAP